MVRAHLVLNFSESVLSQCHHVTTVWSKRSRPDLHSASLTKRK